MGGGGLSVWFCEEGWEWGGEGGRGVGRRGGGGGGGEEGGYHP